MAILKSEAVFLGHPVHTWKTFGYEMVLKAVRPGYQMVSKAGCPVFLRRADFGVVNSLNC